jgi:predicted anti-sigma-YlaC factor YlaD
MNRPTGHDHPDHDCQEIFAALSEYLDGELDETVCERLQRHMDCCGPCQEFLESLRRTVSWLSDQTEPELSPEERQRICEAFRRRCEESGAKTENSDAGDVE